MRMYLFRLLYLVNLLWINLFAGTDGTIRGKIIDERGEPLIGAQIFIPDLGIGTMADEDGNYILLNVEVGDFDVHISMIGFKTKIFNKVDIIMDQTVWLNVTLPKAAIEGDVVNVTAEKELVEKGSTSKKITVSNLEIIKIESDKNILLVKGSIPGKPGNLVII